MKVLIFSNGCIDDYEFVKNSISNYDRVICCDGGVKHTDKLGIIPDYILGDLDSAPSEILEKYRNENVKFKSFPSHKDETDTELGIIFAAEMGADEIDMYGCTGNRFDHTLANAQNLSVALNQNIKARIIDKYNIIQLIDREIVIYGKCGQIVSLIPMTSEVEGIVTEGLEYPLCNEVLKVGASRGISNKMISDTASVKIKSGLLFVIYATD